MSADFEQAVVKLLNDDSAVAALVGTRISFGGLDTDLARPYISCERLSTLPSNLLVGRNTMTQALVEVSANDDSLRGTLSVCEAVRAALESDTRQTVSTSDGDVVISAIKWTDMQQFNPRIGSSTYRVAQFFSVWGDQT